MQESIIIGIDPGYDRVGIAIIKKSHNQDSYVYSTCINTKRNDEINYRIFDICKQLNDIIAKYNPKYAAIEKLYLNTNQKTAMGVAESRGAIIYNLLNNNLIVHEYTPLQIKSALTGYGQAEKTQVKYMTYKLLHLNEDKRIDDEDDALAIALTCSANIRL